MRLAPTTETDCVKKRVGAKLAPLRVPDQLATVRETTTDHSPLRTMLINEAAFTPGISESGILSRVQNFVQESSVYRQSNFVLAEDDRFFEKAALDSKYVAAMIDFVEQEFGIIVSSCEVSEENLGSLRAVARFVASKQPFAVG